MSNGIHDILNIISIIYIYIQEYHILLEIISYDKHILLYSVKQT